MGENGGRGKERKRSEGRGEIPKAVPWKTVKNIIKKNTKELAIMWGEKSLYC